MVGYERVEQSVQREWGSGVGEDKPQAAATCRRVGKFLQVEKSPEIIWLARAYFNVQLITICAVVKSKCAV